MGRKSSSGKSRKHGGGSGYKKHIYFEAKGGGRDSVFAAVNDIKHKGVDTKKELFEIAAAQLADLKTKDHHGRAKKRTRRLWGGRSYILWHLFYKLKNKGKVKESDASLSFLR